MNSNTDITQTIINTIGEIFTKLFSSITTSLYEVLDTLVFITPDVLSDEKFSTFFGTSSSSGILLIANALLFGFMLYFASRYLLSYITYAPVERPTNFIFKLILCGIFMNFSFFALQVFLTISDFICDAILAVGNTVTGKNISFTNLINEISFVSSDDTIDIFSLDGIIQSTISFSLLNLIFSYSLRYIMVKLFIIIAPFAFLSLSLESTSWFFTSWIKTLFSLIFIQFIVAVILVFLFSMDYSNADLLTKFIYIGGIYALIKANTTVREFIGGLSTNIQQHVNNFVGKT